MSLENIERWIGQSAMSDPGRHKAAVAELPSSVAALNGVVQGLIIHTEWLSAYGVDESQFERVSRETVPVAERLALILDSDPRPLHLRRPPARRSVGTCRDFAILLCGLLRSKGIPARLRCGFADYLNDGWEDHWVCEYWDQASQRWRLSDSQIDEVLKEKCEVKFNPTDVPRHQFMTAGQAWTACRASKYDPARFGHGATKGLWFIKVNVFRDHYAINNRETSPWDSWRSASMSQRRVSDRDVAVMDNIAACPLGPIVEIDPDWLT